MSDNGVMSAMADLGIDPSTLDDGSDLETEDVSMDASAEVNDEVVETKDAEFSDDDSEEAPVTPEGDETKVEEAPLEVAQPEQTAKEIQEIAAAMLELSAKEKSFMERMTNEKMEFQKEHHEKLKTHDQMDDFFAKLAEKDPDLFDLVKGEFQTHQKEYAQFEEFRKETQSLREEINIFKAKASDEVTRTKLDSEMNQVKSTLGKEAEAAGIKVDWSKVEDAWADNPKLDLRKAFYAEHGEALLKASVSKAKVEAVTKKVEARPQVATAGSVQRSTAPTKENIPKDAAGAVRYFARQLTGKVS